MKESWKAYYRGYRTAKGFRRNQSFKYYFNPYPYQSTYWYSFNIGWNDARNGIVLYYV